MVAPMQLMFVSLILVIKPTPMNLLKRIRTFAVLMFVTGMLLSATVTSCKQAASGDQEEASEHPAADSTEKAGDEHPKADSEHPKSDSTNAQ